MPVVKRTRDGNLQLKGSPPHCDGKKRKVEFVSKVETDQLRKENLPSAHTQDAVAKRKDGDLQSAVTIARPSDAMNDAKQASSRKDAPTESSVARIQKGLAEQNPIRQTAKIRRMQDSKRFSSLVHLCVSTLTESAWDTVREDVEQLAKAARPPRGRPKTNEDRTSTDNTKATRTLYRCRHCGIKHIGHPRSLDFVVLDHRDHRPTCPRFDVRFRFQFSHTQRSVVGGTWTRTPNGVVMHPQYRSMSAAALAQKMDERKLPYNHCSKAQMLERLCTYDSLVKTKLSVFANLPKDTHDCPCCGQSNGTRGSLFHHLRVQQSIYPAQALTADGSQKAKVWCPCCRQGFTGPETLKLHLAQRAAERAKTTCTNTPTVNSSVGKNAAATLHALPDVAQSVAQHVQWRLNPSRTQITGAVCKHCGHQETAFWRMVKHQVERHQLYTSCVCACPTCGKRSPTLWQLLLHSETCKKHAWSLAEERSLVWGEHILV